jgi:hypothetical protein
VIANLHQDSPATTIDRVEFMVFVRFVAVTRRDFREPPPGLPLVGRFAHTNARSGTP